MNIISIICLVILMTIIYFGYKSSDAYLSSQFLKYINNCKSSDIITIIDNKIIKLNDKYIEENTQNKLFLSEEPIIIHNAIRIGELLNTIIIAETGFSLSIQYIDSSKQS